MRRRPHHHHLRHRSGKVVLSIAFPPSEPLRCPSLSSPFVLDIDVPSVARHIVSPRRLRRRIHSGVFHAVLVSVQPLPAAHVASSPAPVVVVVVLPSFPVVVAFVPPSSRSRSSSSLRQVPQPRHRLRPGLRVAKPCAGRVSPSFKDRRRSRLLAVRLSRARSLSSFPRLVVWW
uniref:Cell wall protein-like n=1 Tax=Oryza glaberrima TaxID=4538 RepID=I1PCN5_ORYGL